MVADRRCRPGAHPAAAMIAAALAEASAARRRWSQQATVTPTGPIALVLLGITASIAGTGVDAAEPGREGRRPGRSLPLSGRTGAARRRPAPAPHRSRDRGDHDGSRGHRRGRLRGVQRDRRRAANYVPVGRHGDAPYCGSITGGSGSMPYSPALAAARSRSAAGPGHRTARHDHAAGREADRVRLLRTIFARDARDGSEGQADSA